MSTPLFLDLDQVIRLHRSLVERYGGAQGVRDVGLLHSAITTPQAAYGGEYLHGDTFEMAAGYLYHIVQNHPSGTGRRVPGGRLQTGLPYNGTIYAYRGRERRASDCEEGG